MLYGTIAESRQKRREHCLDNGTRVWTNQIIAEWETPREHPNAFLVEQGPGEVGAHFHFTDQFQVITHGRALFGRHTVRPFCVHYARAETGYGPIIAGVEGVDYLNLRPVTERGAHYLPAAAKRMTGTARRLQITSDPIDASTPFAMRTRTETLIETVIPEQTCGGAAWVIRAAPGAVLPSLQSENWFGRFYVVLSGILRLPDADLPPLSPIWIAPADDPARLTAGLEGADCLVVQFGPTHATAPGLIS